VDEDDVPLLLLLDAADEDDAEAMVDEEEELAGWPPEPLEFADELLLDPEPHAAAADTTTAPAETIARPLIPSGYHRRSATWSCEGSGTILPPIHSVRFD
jgi:hypothetical protein